MDGITVIIARLRRWLLSSLFVLLYRTGSWGYDPLTRLFFGPAWHNWRRTVIPLVFADGRTLDIACGTGELLNELSAKSSQVVGMDQSPSMLARARERSGDRRITLVQADARQLPFRRGSFDTIVSTFPASFIAEDSVLEQIANVLVPGGRLVVVASAQFTRFQWRRPLIHPLLRLAYGSTSSMNRWPEDMLHHPLLPGEWQDLRTPEGKAFVWIATRRDDTARTEQPH